MRCDIYNSLSQKGVRLYIREGVLPKNLLPQMELEKISPLETHNDFKSVPFSLEEPLIGVSVEKIISNVNRQGYYIHTFEVKVEIKEEPRVSEAGAALGGGLLLASLGAGPIGAVVGAAIGFLLASSSKEKN